MPANAEADTFLIEDDAPSDPAAPALPEPAPWRILIVDDDVDVHVVTKFALSNANFQGRRLSFLHAYSGKEALTVLRDNPDVALVLLDVIMESEDAGLRVARLIRDELHNDMVRIVLRTGHPGQALEHSIIVDYDINDFWCKADLTTRKLFTTVISSLRAYAALAQAREQNDTLARELAQARQVQMMLGQQALIVTLDGRGQIQVASELFCRVAGQPGEALVGRALSDVYARPLPQGAADTIMTALAQHGSWHGELALTARDGSALVLRCAVTALNAGGAAGAVGTSVQHYVGVATVLPTSRHSAPDPAPAS